MLLKRDFFGGPYIRKRGMVVLGGTQFRKIAKRGTVRELIYTLGTVSHGIN